MRKFFISLIMFLSLATGVISVVQSAGLIDSSVTGVGSNAEEVQKAAGFASADQASLSQYVAVIIKTFLGLLGVIFVVLLVMAGFKWMRAAGDKGKLEEAQKQITNAIIGLVIITAAYVITYFVFANLPGGGGASQFKGGGGS